MGAAPSAAHAAATVQTYHFAGFFTVAGSPCGQPGTATFTFDQAVLHSTTTPNGVSRETSTQVGTATFTPDGATSPTYTGHFTQTSDTFTSILVNATGGRLDFHQAQNQPPVIHCS
ncbi:MAG: hypothetical protein NVS3B21_23070 [Acidimicrobiales bacterium]